MDKKLSIAHMEFAEVAAYLLSSAENKEEGDKGVNDTDSDSDGRHRGAARESDSDTAHSSRIFLAQHTLSEIPTLEQDVSPFPDITKTGMSRSVRLDERQTVTVDVSPVGIDTNRIQSAIILASRYSLYRCLHVCAHLQGRAICTAATSGLEAAKVRYCMQHGLYCTVLYRTVLSCIVLYRPAMCLNVMHSCSVLFCIALLCKELYCPALYRTAVYRAVV
jgi:hypothetical protein